MPVQEGVRWSRTGSCWYLLVQESGRWCPLVQEGGRWCPLVQNWLLLVFPGAGK